MQAVVEIKFEELLKIVKTLTPAKLSRLKSELDKSSASVNRKSLKELLLSGPTLSETELYHIEENRKNINAWREI